MMAEPQEEDEMIAKQQFDELSNDKARLQELYDQAVEKITGLEQALTKISIEKAKIDEGEALVTEPQMVTNFVMDCLKLKPRQIIIKYRGNTVIEIKPRK